jgi:hypothetical protein
MMKPLSLPAKLSHENAFDVADAVMAYADDRLPLMACPDGTVILTVPTKSGLVDARDGDTIAPDRVGFVTVTHDD